MSWDPSTAVISDQSTDFYARASIEVSNLTSHTKIVVDQVEKELRNYEPKELGSWQGRKIIVISSGISGSDNAMNKDMTVNKIENIKQIQFSIQHLAEDFNHSIKKFRILLAAEHVPLNFRRFLGAEIFLVDEKIANLNMICENYLLKYQDLLVSQTNIH